MKKLYKQWKYARLRTWLIVFFLMFSIIPLGVLGIIVFRLSKAELTKQAQEHFWQNAKNTSALLDNAGLYRRIFAENERRQPSV